MKQRIIWGLAAVVIAGIMGCTATAQKTNHLRLGMTKQEVLQVMDNPVSTTARGDVEVLRYELYETRYRAFHDFAVPYFIWLKDGRVKAYGKIGDFYVEPTGVLKTKEQQKQKKIPEQMS
jgi:hypothetical protein